jgi:hypothetical protein
MREFRGLPTMSSRRNKAPPVVSPPRAPTWLRIANALSAACFGLVAATLVASGDTATSQRRGDESFTPQDEARAHILRRPFDFVGYTALADTLSSPQQNAAISKEIKSLLISAKTLAPTDPIVMRAQIRVAHHSGQHATAMELASHLLDRSPADANDALVALAAMQDEASWPQFASKRLAQGWPGADVLALYLCDRNTNTNNLLLFAHQIARLRPISLKPLHCIERKLIRDGLYENAYHLRLIATPQLARRVDFVFNGEFESSASGSPFDWNLSEGGAYRSGFDVALRRGTDNGRTGGKLFARFHGRQVKAPLITQHLALIPGRYRISYVTAESGFGPGEAPQWTVRCLGNTRPTEPLTWEEKFEDDNWLIRTATFSLSSDCPGQLLSYEVTSRLKALEGLRGTLVMDSVKIERPTK